MGPNVNEHHLLLILHSDSEPIDYDDRNLKQRLNRC